MRPLSLHQLTALDARPIDLIDIAADAGYASVCVFGHAPGRLDLFPIIPRADLGAFKARLRDRAITVCNVESFHLFEDTEVDQWLDALDLTAELGASRVTAHIQDADPGRASANLRRLCDHASARGLSVGVEFHGMSKCPGINDAASLLDLADARNCDIILDVLHLMRTGGGLSDVRRHRDRIHYVQLSDGPVTPPSSAYIDEALFERQVPGAGAFPLRDLLEAVSPSVKLSIEVPLRPMRVAGTPPLDRARTLAKAVWQVLEQAGVADDL